ncbi:MAG: YHYH protein [Myxococcota bacterium]
MRYPPITLLLTLVLSLSAHGCGDSADADDGSGDDISAAASDASAEGSSGDEQPGDDTESATDATASQESGDTAGPVEPSDATDPVDPTDATDTAEPTDPTDTPEPSDPTDPTDPWADGCPDEVFLDLTHPWVGAGDGFADLTLEVSCDLDAGTMTVTSNGIPHYSYVSMTPNALVAANHSWTVPLNPEIADEATELPLLGDAGFGVNGSVWYGPNEGPFPDPFGDPVANGIMDWCGGHTAAAYHFHYMTETMLIDWDGDGEPACMDTEDLNEAGESYVIGSQPSPIVGFALDGFPIYGPYGCTDADCTEVIEFHSSWQNISPRDGTVGCQSTAECGNPDGGVCDGPMSASFDAYQCATCAPVNIDGEITTACVPTTEAWDNHAFVTTEGEAWLDLCNGRIGPDGTYRYHATATFPYIIGCYRGTPTAAGGGPGGGGDDGPPDDGGAPDGGGPPDGGPASCTTDADCDGECPNVALGCVCHSGPMGMMCVPACTSDVDCPNGLTCNTDGGICTPGAGGPPGG